MIDHGLAQNISCHKDIAGEKLLAGISNFIAIDIAGSPFTSEGAQQANIKKTVNQSADKLCLEVRFFISKSDNISQFLNVWLELFLGLNIDRTQEDFFQNNGQRGQEMIRAVIIGINAEACYSLLGQRMS